MNYEKVYNSCALLGSLRFFANISNSIHLIHGPSGCTYFSTMAVHTLNNVQIRQRCPQIYSTDFNENDVVFGGTEKIKSAILELHEKYAPEVIFVYNCCVTEIIGENIEDICNSLQANNGINCIPVKSAGFKGNHQLGMKEAGKLLVSRLLRDVTPEPIKRSINILGNMQITNHSLRELTYYLQKAGIHINIVFPGESSLSQIRQMPNAELNYVLCGVSSLQLAQDMNDKFNIPYILDGKLFTGVNHCRSMLNEVYSHFSVSSEEYIHAHSSIIERLEGYRKYFCNKTAIVVAGSSRSMGYTELLTELGIEVKLVFSEENDAGSVKNDLLKFSTGIMLNESAEQLSKIISELSPDYVVTTLKEIVMPEPYIYLKQRNYSGFNGVLQLAEELQASDKSPVNRYYRALSRKK